jgi:hypothetical protein
LDIPARIPVAIGTTETVGSAPVLESTESVETLMRPLKSQSVNRQKHEIQPTRTTLVDEVNPARSADENSASQSENEGDEAAPCGSESVLKLAQE